MKQEGGRGRGVEGWGVAANGSEGVWKREKLNHIHIFRISLLSFCCHCLVPLAFPGLSSSFFTTVIFIVCLPRTTKNIYRNGSR